MTARLRIVLFASLILGVAAAIVLAAVFVIVRNFPVYPLTEQNLPSREELLTVLLGIAGTVSVFIVVFGCSAAWLFAGLLLQPLDRLRRNALRAADGDLSERVGTDRRDEIGALASAFDSMLDRLQDAMGAQARFAANAAHELRTPMAVMRTVIEVAGTDPARAEDEVLRRIAIMNERAIETCEALLALSDVNAVAAHRTEVDLRTVIAEALDDVRPALDRSRLQPRVTIADAAVRGDRRLLRQAFRNLFDNAARHGDPGELRCDVSMRRRGTVLVRLENPGPVLSATTVETLHEPFVRAVGRTTGGTNRTGGHGLGLALVDRTMQVHGGSMMLQPRGGGGLVVRLTFPAE